MSMREYESFAEFIRSKLRMKRVPSVERLHAQLGGIIGVVDLVDVTTTSKWFVGPVGVLFRNPRPCDYVAMKGRLRLFTVPDEVSSKIPSGLR